MTHWRKAFAQPATDPDPVSALPAVQKRQSGAATRCIENRDFITFSKIDPEAVGGDKRLPGPRIALVVGATSREPIRQPAPRFSADGSQADLAAALARSPFIPLDSKPRFPPFNLKQTTLDIFTLGFGLFFLCLLVASFPLAVVMMFVAGF